MEFNGKVLSIELKKENKSTVEFTSNINVDYGKFEDNVSKTLKITVDAGPSDNFSTIIRSFIGHALIRIGLNSAALQDEKVMKSRKCVSMPEYKNFGVSKIAFKGDGEDEILFVTMTWKTPEGEVVAIPAPGIKTMSGDYNFQKYLEDDIANFRKEVVEFIKDKNYKPSQQLDLFKQGAPASIDEDENEM